MFGARVVAQTRTRDLPQLARFLQRALLARNASISPAVRALSHSYRASPHHSRRAYATTTKATKPTATVKKAVKAKAATKTPRKTTTAAKPKRAPAAGARKTTTRKTTTKKTIAKKAAPRKAVAKKAAPKKVAPRKRVKKVLTPEQADKAKKVQLRKTALREPVTHGSISAFNVYAGEQLKGSGSADPNRMRNAAANWKSLTPAEHEHYNHLAHEQTAARQAEYQAWIRTHTPQQIAAANRARLALRTKYADKTKKRPAHTTKLVDDRHPKGLTPTYTYFFTERMASGDFKGIKLQDYSKLIGEEWKALSAGEKKKYQDMGAADKARYTRETAALT